ncbi:hypothetical protein WN51_07601 [Melipona quadrifasciata]|uniref:Uncharacterized protein n=1 Tax=Melipona quadrifasciata TaxID=166423 RepID=A0A0N0BBS9_9HYME|nr:hypothetical protein WN51_07601 [Melipona quadrifasciata]
MNNSYGLCFFAGIYIKLLKFQVLQIRDLLQQFPQDVGMLRMVLCQDSLESVSQFVVHTLDQFGVAQSWSIRGDHHHRTEQSQFRVRQPQGVHPLGKVEHRVHEEPSVTAIVDGLSFQHLPVQADHAVRLSIEHAGQPHQQHLEHAGLQQRDLVVLCQQAKARNAFRELHHTADRRENETNVSRTRRLTRRNIKLYSIGICTHQGRRTRGIVRRLSSSDQDRGYLVPGKVACVEMSLHNGSQKPLLVFQLGRYCLLLRTAVGALLHSSQNPGLLALGHAAESHRYKQKQHEWPTSRRSRDILGDLYYVITWRKRLTIATHPDSDALLEAAILAAIPVDTQDATLLILSAGPVLDLLLNAASEESLRLGRDDERFYRAHELVSWMPGRGQQPLLNPLLGGNPAEVEPASRGGIVGECDRRDRVLDFCKSYHEKEWNVPKGTQTEPI